MFGPVIVFPHVKLNLGLHITARRADGYHDLETVFLPVPACGDILEILPADKTELVLTGLPIAGALGTNLVLRAYRLLASRHAIGPAHMHLHKLVPTGTGLGAGSADATFALRGFSTVFNLGLSVAEIASLAAELGSDTAFFAYNRPMLGQGRGEVLTPVAVDLQGWYILIVLPKIHVSTKEAFVGVVPKPAPKPLATLVQQPVATWKAELHNQFEDTVFKAHPGLAQIKEYLYQAGATYAAMSGSGSAFFGLFAQNPGPADMGWHQWNGYKAWVGRNDE